MITSRGVTAVFASTAVHLALFWVLSSQLPVYQRSSASERFEVTLLDAKLDHLLSFPQPQADTPPELINTVKGVQTVINEETQLAINEANNIEFPTQSAPQKPSEEEWAFAKGYTLKNSKGYRYLWGKQVRSMMGAAVAGEQSGQVRFRIEIDPSGQITKLETVWSTSQHAENLARAAISKITQLPPTPTGEMLVFERTIVFSPFEEEWPPIYDETDCQPETLQFKNPFVWNGGSTSNQTEGKSSTQKHEELSIEDCRAMLPQNSLEAEIGREEKIMKRWGARQLNK